MYIHERDNWTDFRWDASEVSLLQEKVFRKQGLLYGRLSSLGFDSNASDITPSWFKKSVEAALLAPTAVNQQKFSFEHVGVKNNCHQIRAKKGFSMIGYTKMDLGIAKYHFEIGAGKEIFEWI